MLHRQHDEPVLLPRNGWPVLWKSKLSPSAVAIILACLVTAYHGASVLAFLSGAERVSNVLSNTPEGAPNFARGALPSFAASWKDKAGVADLARGLARAIVQDEKPDDQAAAEAAVSDIAANTPATHRVWLDLANARIARGAPLEEVLAAFRMLDLTASHEGIFMVERATFGLEHWRQLPESDRAIVVRDMAATINSYFKPQERYREILAKKSAAERGDILASLMASGRGTPEVLRELGQ